MTVPIVLVAVGAVLIVAGATIWFWPAGLIAAGLLALLAGLLLDTGDPE